MDWLRRHWVGLAALLLAALVLAAVYWIARSTGVPTYGYEIR